MSPPVKLFNFIFYEGTSFHLKLVISHNSKSYLPLPSAMLSTADETVTKRLHISGLTRQIAYNDLQTRLSSFGTVKAVDGLGKLDANGDLRPYAYVTIESTKGQLSKCQSDGFSPPNVLIDS